MNDLLVHTLLSGLEKHGREKTFAEILEERQMPIANSVRLSLAASLEESGLIQNVVYKLPFEIRAELTERGKKHIIDSKPKSLTDGFSQGVKFLILFFNTLFVSHILGDYTVLNIDFQFLCNC